MSIDKNRGDFLAVIIIALLAAAASLPGIPAFICCAIIIGCAIVLAWMPEQHAGYLLGALALISSGVASAALLSLLGDLPPSVIFVAAIATMGLVALWLVRSWSKRTPVLYSQQVVLSTAFGTHKIIGPYRMREPKKWLGNRVIARLSLRAVKLNVNIKEIDLGAPPDLSTTIRILRPEMIDLAAIGPKKIHAIELSVSYSIDGDRWFLLYNIPRPGEHTASLGRGIGRDHPEYWETLTMGYITEEADDVLRRVIHREGWDEATVRDQRDMVAAQFLEELRIEVDKMGLLIHEAELHTIDIDAAETLRAARNSSVINHESAESQARVGSVRIGLHRDILRQMRELLSDREHPLPAEAIAAIVRAQIRELSRPNTPLSEIEDVLEESLAISRDAQRSGPTTAGPGRPSQPTRGAA